MQIRHSIFHSIYSSHAAEDMWHVYNLIREGDHVTATTFRKVAKDHGTGTESEKIKLKLTVQVESIDFDAEGRLCIGQHGLLWA